MPLTLSITGCNVDTNLITITFSDAVDKTSASGSTNATDAGNYTIFDPDAGFRTPTALSSIGVTVNPNGNDDDQTVTFQLTGGSFNAGDIVLITVSNIALASDPGNPALIDDPVSVAREVPGGGVVGTTTKNVEDAISYPLLTEEIGYRPSPVGIPVNGGGGGGGAAMPATSNLGQVALRAVSDVLGWKANSTDAKGFVGALTQAFTLADVEGHVEATWTPRTYAVQTDLGGGITGAQASLYMRAKDALDQSLSLLDGLYPLDPEADPEYVKALREMARSQMTEIVREFGVVGLPSILRIDTYFKILLGQNPADLIANSQPVQFDPDQIGGTLGDLRDTYGIYFVSNPFNNSVADEQDITNFRVISDYMTSLMQSWIANRQFFIVAPNQLAFFGTQLVLISRQFSVIAETVNEVRFALDSVFIGPAERQTLLLEFSDPSLSPMFLEDVLDEVEKFATEEGPRLLRDGGKISVTNNVLPVVQSLQNMVEQAHDPANINQLPDGFRTARVRRSLDDLQDQLEALINLTEQVEQQVPAPESRLAITSIAGIPSNPDGGGGLVSILGGGFDPGAVVRISSAFPIVVAPPATQFYSSQRIDAPVTDPNTWRSLFSGSHEVTVTNPTGDSLTVTLPKGLSADRLKATAMVMKRGAQGGRKQLAATGGIPSAPRPRPTAPPPAPVSKTPPPAPATTPAPAAGSGVAAALQSQLAQLQKGHEELKQSHKTVLDKLEGLEQSIVARLSDLFKGKDSKDKDKKDKDDKAA